MSGDDYELPLLDRFGHQWDVGWQEFLKPHPYMGPQPVYAAYVPQCVKCGIYGEEFMQQLCGKKVRGFVQLSFR